MREQSLINLQQRLLIVDKEIQDVGLVLIGEVSDLDPVLGQLGQPQQTLLKLFGLFTGLLQLLKLLSIVDLVLQPPLHDVLPHLFNALDEQRFQFVPLRAHVHLVSDLLLLFAFLLVYDHLEVPDRISVTRLQRLHILDNLILDVLSLHPRLENQLDKLLKFDILRGNVAVARPWTSGGSPSSRLTLASLGDHTGVEVTCLGRGFHSIDLTEFIAHQNVLGGGHDRVLVGVSGGLLLADTLQLGKSFGGISYKD